MNAVHASSVEFAVSIRRLFRPDDVRITGTRFDGRIGFLFDDNGNDEEDKPYRVALYGDETDENFSASELTLWSPKASERVVEANNENCVIGIVIDVFDECRALVKWPGFTRLQSWLYADLEPLVIDF
jgi:hypothetical protein